VLPGPVLASPVLARARAPEPLVLAPLCSLQRVLADSLLRPPEPVEKYTSSQVHRFLIGTHSHTAVMNAAVWRRGAQGGTTRFGAAAHVISGIAGHPTIGAAAVRDPRGSGR
jgi:hypothetical protein